MNQPSMDPELLSAYLDGELSEEEAAWVEQWLAGSAEARRMLERLRAASDLVRQLPRHALGEEFTQQVLSALKDQPPQKPLTFRRRFPTWVWWGGGVAAAAAVAAVILWLPPSEQPLQVAQRPSEPAPRDGDDGLMFGSQSPRVEGPETEPLASKKELADAVPQEGLEVSKRAAGGKRDQRTSAASRDAAPHQVSAPMLERMKRADVQQLRQREGAAPRSSAFAAGVGGKIAREGAQRALVQNLEQLDPDRTVQLLQLTGAGVVELTSSSPDQGLAAVQHLLQKQQVPPSDALADRPASPEVAEQESLPALAADESVLQDAVYVEASAEQIRAALVELKSSRPRKLFSAIAVQATEPQQLEEQLRLQGVPALADVAVSNGTAREKSFRTAPLESESDARSSPSNRAAAPPSEAPSEDSASAKPVEPGAQKASDRLAAYREQSRAASGAFRSRQVPLKIKSGIIIVPHGDRKARGLGGAARLSKDESITRPEPSRPPPRFFADEVRGRERENSASQPSPSGEPEAGRRFVEAQPAGPLRVLFLFRADVPPSSERLEPATND